MQTAVVNSDEKIKCVVWDLDHTLWDGVLSEGDVIQLRPEVERALQMFDERGILQSVASKNNEHDAVETLRVLGVDKYLLYPQIHWAPKSQSIRTIAEKLNIGLNTFAFVDDQPFERDEVLHHLPDVRTFDPVDIVSFEEMAVFQPRFITEDTRVRRVMYQEEMARSRDRERFDGPEESFLRTLGMVLRVSPATEADLQRAEELTQRTNQLNTTGIGYSYDELREKMEDPHYLLLVATLEDRYGSSGTIGLVLAHKDSSRWLVELLLISCRVISRGVGGVLITLLRKLCQQRDLALDAMFRETDRNRMMYVTYRFAGFTEGGREGDRILMHNDLTSIPAFPDYVDLRLHPSLEVSS